VKCDELIRLLAEYQDGALDRALCSELERHIDDCAPCGELRHDLETLARLCRCAPRPRLPEDVRERLLRRLRS
jgi:hypothetical protein